MQTPVALIIFNRPDVTARVAEVIAKARPPKIFIAADGPRPDRQGEVEKCAATRAVIDRIDWPCEVVKKYSDVNLGCGHGPATGLDWVFQQTDRAIILEDDCLAHPSFFPYCDELLEKYRDDERIMQIAGSNFQRGQVRGAYSYFFSRFKICWGWATWRRAWRHMDMSVRLWPELRNTPWLLDIAGDPRLAQHWSEKLDLAHQNASNIDYWDYQWTFATWAQNGLCIKPEVNMISNIGFGKEATHTTWSGNKWANLPIKKMFFPLLHPPFVTRNKEADDCFVQEAVAQDIPQPERLYRQVYNKVRRAYAATVPASVRMLLHHFHPLL